MSISAISSGLSGLQRASQSFEASASRIANPAGKSDMATDLVDIMAAKIDFEASTKVIKIASDLQKTTIDILA